MGRSLESNNERLKARMVAREALDHAVVEETRLHLRFATPRVLVLLLVVLAAVVWRQMSLQAVVEKPPETLTLTDLKDVNEGGQYVEGHCANQSGRRVKKVVYQLSRGAYDAPLYVVLEDLKSGETRSFRVPSGRMLSTPSSAKVSPPGKEWAVVPYSVEWK